MTTAIHRAVRSILRAATVSASTLSISTGVASIAHAQTPASDATPQLSEIVVTAQRRTESLQNVSIAISAFSSEQLAGANVTDSSDLEHVTPNLIFAESGRDGQIFIRGIGSTRLSGAGADPSSSTYIDGVYRSRGTSALLELLDVQRVEVLRGPQGTLYGRNSTGGAVRYISEDPGRELAAKVRAESGNYDHFSVLAQGDVPITDSLQMRAVYLHSRHDGYTKNLQHPGETFGRKDLNAGRLTIKYTPTQSIDLTLHAGMSKDDSDQTALKHYIDPLGAFRTAEFIDDPRLVRSDYGPRRAPISNWYADLTANWNLGNIRVSSITGFVSLDVGPYNGDLDVTEIAGVTDGRNGLPVGIEDGGDSFTQEFNVTSQGAGAFQWSAGAYFLHDRNYTLRQGLYVPLVPSLAANHRTFDARGTTKSYAAFANGSYTLADLWRFNAGLRYSKETKTIDRAQFNNLTLINGPRSDEKSWSDVTPKIGVDLLVSDDMMPYVSYSKGFKSGAFNASSFEAAVNPEYVDAFEAGVKTRWFDRRLVLNGAAFYYDYQDMQVQGLDPNNIGTEIVRNAAGATIKGAELELNYLAFANFQINATGSYLKATYAEFPTLAGDLSGNRLPNAPRWTANLGLAYTVPMASAGALKLNGNVFATAEKFLSETNNTLNARQGGYSMFDANATWENDSGRFSVTLYGKNLADKVVYTRTVTQAALLRTGYLAYLEPPRTYGVRVNVGF